MELATELKPVAPDKALVYREIARRLCAHQTVQQIARILNRTPSTIRKWMRDEQFQDILRAMDEQVWSDAMADLKSNVKQSIFVRAQEDVDDAYDTLAALMRDSRSEGIRYKAANDLINLATGLRVPDVNDKMGQPHLTNVQINNFKETVIQVHGRHDGTAPGAIDVEVSSREDV
jgi:hypothetical protein